MSVLRVPASPPASASAPASPASGPGEARAALDALLPTVYDALRALARRHRRAWSGDHTLDTTALVHETYLRLAAGAQVPPASRARVLGVAAKAMRHVLCDRARERRAAKRGGPAPKLSFDALGDGAASLALTDAQSEVLGALDEALGRLAALDARLAHVVECRFFAGLTIDETAAALGTSPATVKRDWALARAWLYRELHDAGDA